MKVRVIGAGVVGLACASELRTRGATVEVVERSATLGANACSWVAGGMLSPGCERESAEALVADWGAEAIDWWTQRTGLVARRGSLVIAAGRDAPDLDRFARMTSGYQRLDEAGIADLEPDLAGRFRAGLFFPDEGHLDPRAALTALADGLAASGQPIRFGVDGVAEPADKDTIVLDCRGLNAAADLPDLRGVRGEMLIVRCPDVKLSRPVRLLHPRWPLYVVPRPDGTTMIGATMIESGDRRGATARAVAELIGAAWALHPAFGEAEIVEIGADARPSFPDNLPRVRRDGRVLQVNGLYRHGFLLSPALARRVADHVLLGTPLPEVLNDRDYLERRRA